MSIGAAAFTGSLLSEGGPRFRFLGIIPSVILFFFLFFIIGSWTLDPSQVPNFGVVIERIGSMTIQETALLIIAVVLFSLLMEPLQLSLVRVLEGYWENSALGRRMAAIGKDFQVVNFDAQKGSGQGESNAENDIYYPKEIGRFLPTALGNILRAAEDRAGRKYGINAIIFWPRLYPLLSENIKGIVDDLRNQLDIAARFCVIFMISGIAAVAVYLFIINTAASTNFLIDILNTAASRNFLASTIVGNMTAFTYGLWLLIPLAAFFISWVSFRAAVAAAASFGQGLDVTFDLSRFELLKALHLPLPQNLREEKEKNIRLRSFFATGTSTDPFDYEHDDDEKVETTITNTTTTVGKFTATEKTDTTEKSLTIEKTDTTAKSTTADNAAAAPAAAANAAAAPAAAANAAAAPINAQITKSRLSRFGILAIGLIILIIGIGISATETYRITNNISQNDIYIENQILKPLSSISNSFSVQDPERPIFMIVDLKGSDKEKLRHVINSIEVLIIDAKGKTINSTTIHEDFFTKLDLKIPGIYTWKTTNKLNATTTLNGFLGYLEIVHSSNIISLIGIGTVLVISGIIITIIGIIAMIVDIRDTANQIRVEAEARQRVVGRQRAVGR